MAADLLVVEDHPVFQQALSQIIASLQPNARVRACSTLGEALDALATGPEPGVVLLDLNLPDSAGLATLEAVRRVARSAAIVVLTADDSAREAGPPLPGVQLLAKSSRPAQLISVLERLLASAGAGGRIEQLSARQLAVLELLARGASNKEIAAELQVSLETVKDHVSEVLARLGVANRTQAVSAFLAARWRV
jgi:DNA-binding NarL/FixJ family response regulator